MEHFCNLNLDPARFARKKRVRDGTGSPIKGTFSKLYRSTFAGHDVALKEVDDVEHRPRLRQVLLMATTMTPTEAMTELPLQAGDKRVLREVAVLAALRHPNIVTFIGLLHDSQHSTLSFVLSWAENGSLYDYIHVHKKEISDVEKLRILNEVAAAMEFLHAHDVVHRDLKSPNVLLDASLSAKVADFGLSAFRRPGQSQLSKVIGTELWASPEQLFGHTLRADTDVFSFGCLAWELWTMIRPWHHVTADNPVARVEKLKEFYRKAEYLPLCEEVQGRRLSATLQELLRGCFQMSGNRIDFSQLHAALKAHFKAATEQQAEDEDKQKQLMDQQHLLLHGPPNAVWKFPQELLDAVDATKLSTRQSVRIAPLQLGDDAVIIELVHAAGGRTAKQNPREPFGCTLCRVAITWCDQKLVAFKGALDRNTTRYRGHLASTSHPFAPKYGHDTTTGQATDAEDHALLKRVTHDGVYRMLDPSLLQHNPPIRIQRVFHGVRSLDAVVGILGGDFVQLQTMDRGWYGAGFYFTPDLDYALAYTGSGCGVEPDNSNVPPDLSCLNLEPGKSYRIVLACDVMYGNPYPVTHDSLHPAFSKKAKEKPEELPAARWMTFAGQPLVPGHDAHVTVVNFTSGAVKEVKVFKSHTEWAQSNNKTAAEIVVADPSCVLVRGLLVFEC